MTEKELIKKVSTTLSKIFSRVTLKSPYYEMLRELQKDIYLYENKKQTANELRKKGNTIRQIARMMGYKHPGSISHLLRTRIDKTTIK